MNSSDNDFSTQQISPTLISQIVDAVKNKAWGSIEIYVENFHVTQITERTITKISKGPQKTEYLKKAQTKTKFEASLSDN